MMIDSHCHLHDDKFASDLDAVLERAAQAKLTHLISIGCDIETTSKAQELASRIANIYFSAGFHPHEAKFLDDENYKKLETLARDPKCVAIGECGLDFYYQHSSKDDQERAFIKQIILAQELNLPIIIHLRDAFDACINILKTHKKNQHKTVIHCFSGTLAEAKELEALGCHISLSGIVTFKKPGELCEVAREIALNKLLIETDCPYLSPHPHRGQRNEPAFLSYTLKAVAAARGEPLEQVAPQIYANSLDFFCLKDA